MTTYTLNAEKNGVEITFGEKPSTEIRNKLKELGFRWHGLNKLWYAKQTDERIQFAITLANTTETEPTTEDKPKAEAPVDFSDWSGEHSAGYMGATRWDGSKSNLRLYGSDLSKAIRNDLKAHGIKGCTVKHHSFANGQEIIVTVTAEDGDFTVQDIDKYKNTDVSYRLDREDKLPISDEFRVKLTRVKQCLNAYNYEDNNAMVDYFNTNFYYSIRIK